MWSPGGGLEGNICLIHWKQGKRIEGCSRWSATGLGRKLGGLIWRREGKGEDLHLTYLLLWRESSLSFHQRWPQIIFIILLISALLSKYILQSPSTDSYHTLPKMLRVHNLIHQHPLNDYLMGLLCKTHYILYIK